MVSSGANTATRQEERSYTGLYNPNSAPGDSRPLSLLKGPALEGSRPSTHEPSADSALASGELAACTLLGITPGDDNSRIARQSMEKKLTEATNFLPSEPGTIYYDRGVQKLAEAISFHETVIAIDKGFNHELSSKALEQFYKNNWDEVNFLVEISGKQFLPGMPLVGRPWDSAQELMASLVQSLSHPDWEKKVGTLSEKSRSLYRDALKALESNLSCIDAIPPNAPLREILAEKVQFLDDSLKPERSPSP